MTILQKITKKLCDHYSAFIYKAILILIQTDVYYDNILDKLEFERKKHFVITLAPLFID